jgi:hypothetical protein
LSFAHTHNQHTYIQSRTLPDQTNLLSPTDSPYLFIIFGFQLESTNRTRVPCYHRTPNLLSASLYPDIFKPGNRTKTSGIAINSDPVPPSTDSFIFIDSQ